jgi:molecular chaperone IbpA
MKAYSIDTNALSNMNRALIGFDQLFDSLEGRMAQNSSNNYPPFNILQTSDNEYQIEIAVAGFKRDEIEITIDQHQLTVEGKKSEKELPEGQVYHYRGLAARDFYRAWTLEQYVEVRGAEIVDGILTIKLERVLPEALKPRKIEIADTIETSQPRLSKAA